MRAASRLCGLVCYLLNAANLKASHKMRRLTLAVAFVLVPCAVFADAFVLSGVINRRLLPDELVWIDGSARNIEELVLEGTMNISSVPTVIDAGDRYRVAYAIEFNYAIASRPNIFGTGSMIVDGNGCGLFDCNMAGNAVNSLGHGYRWTVDHGAFFHPDGSPYPNVFVDALPYAVPPERFELYGLEFLQLSGSRELGGSFYMNTPLVAQRVPEPSTLLLAGLGLAAFYRSRRAARH
jgi:hypothetical protein